MPQKISFEVENNRFKTIERLKSKVSIARLFADSLTAKAYPLRLVYRKVDVTEAETPFKIGFVASKRNFKKAPDRNFIKRRMREVYRLNKVELYSKLADKNLYLEGMLIFTGRDLPNTKAIEKAWKKLILRIS